jgi:uncharacterized Zn finger protein
VPRESAYDKGSRLLTEARVIVLVAGRGTFAASVRGEGAVYRTRYSLGSWDCTCPAYRPTCSHIAACKRISAVDVERRR